MLRKTRNSIQALVAAALLAAALLVGASGARAAALPLGDCDGDGSTGIAELQKCINLFLGDPGTCKQCDAQCDPESVGIDDLQKDINCFLDTTDPTCPTANCMGGEPPFCGDGMVNQASETCDNGGACFGGTNEGNLCTSQAECPGGACQAFGGDGCAKNCTTEKTLTYTFSGALCKNHPQQSCTFSSSCVGGTLVGRPCTTNTDCGAGGTCQSECGANDVCVGDGECTVPGMQTKAQCYMADSSNEAKFCAGGANAGKICSVAADCPASSCVGSCAAAGGVCENRSRSALVSLALPVLIGPMIGSSVIRYGAPGADGMVPVATHLGDTTFAPVKVPGLVCACVRGGPDPKSHGPGNNGSGIVNCGATPIQNDVTLAQDHTTAPPKQCVDGPKKGMPCLNRCAAGGGRAGKPCIQDQPDCPGDTGAQRKCNSVTDCGSKQSNGTCTGGDNAGQACTSDANCPNSVCNFITNLQLCTSNNGPGVCAGGTLAGRACFDSSQCLGGGKCTGKCVAGPNIGTACSCDGNARVCETATSFACGTGGTCAIAGNGGGFCMGPGKFCSGGTADGKACFGNAECPGGTCPGTGNFLGYCDSNDDCPGSLCNSIDDAACTMQDPLPPAGSGAKACLETKQICTAGTSLGQPCTADSGCGAGGHCGTTCSANSTHPFVCNSPAHIVLSGSGGSGSGLFLNTISIGTISDGGTCGFAALCMGGANDAKACFIAADCPGGTCASAVCAGTCAGGSAMGKNCLNNTDCPGSTCVGGDHYKESCTSNANCGTAKCVPASGFGAGSGLGAGKGFDGLPCTDDDDAAVRGVQQTIPQTTGRALAMVGDAQNIAGQQLVHRNCIQSSQGDNCKTTLVGDKLNCDNLLNSPNPVATGLRLANAFPTLDGQTGDAVVTTFLTAK